MIYMCELTSVPVTEDANLIAYSLDDHTNCIVNIALAVERICLSQKLDPEKSQS